MDSPETRERGLTEFVNFSLKGGVLTLRQIDWLYSRLIMEREWRI